MKKKLLLLAFFLGVLALVGYFNLKEYHKARFALVVSPQSSSEERLLALKLLINQ